MGAVFCFSFRPNDPVGILCGRWLAAGSEGLLRPGEVVTAFDNILEPVAVKLELVLKLGLVDQVDDLRINLFCEFCRFLVFAVLQKRLNNHIPNLK